jgi:hypothetical protein
MGICGAAATAMAILLYELTMGGVTGLTGSGAGSGKTATA